MSETINDDEIRVIGQKPTMTPKKKRTLILIGVVLTIVLLVVILFLVLRQNDKTDEIVQNTESQTVNQKNTDEQQNAVLEADITVSTIVDNGKATLKVSDTTVNGIKLRRFMPGFVSVELKMYDTTLVNDSTIVFLTQAANIRGDNHNIIGDFVYEGTPKAKGCPESATGFCAIIGNSVILGKGDTTKYLNSAKAQKGYFFRQAIYVKGGVPITFSSDAKSYRRAICSLNKDKNQFLIIESLDKVTMQEFADALSDYEVVNAVGLMGSFILDEWYRKDNGERVQLFTNNNPENPNRNYLIFRAK
ncbi:MAG: hypothetical protein IKX51_03300 [Bacteroidales bacterium]|nr:hypothetical protein [Bacteroidales bacterium]